MTGFDSGAAERPLSALLPVAARGVRLATRVSPGTPTEPFDRGEDKSDAEAAALSR
jgi:hypothetical protein